MTRFVAFSLFLLTRVAIAGVDHEEPPRPIAPTPEPQLGSAFIAGGVLIGVDHFLNMAWLLDGGVRVPSLPIWLHAGLAYGNSVDFAGGGSFRRGTIGFEFRSCSVAGNCT